MSNAINRGREDAMRGNVATPADGELQSPAASAAKPGSVVFPRGPKIPEGASQTGAGEAALIGLTLDLYSGDEEAATSAPAPKAPAPKAPAPIGLGSLPPGMTQVIYDKLTLRS